MALQGKCDGCRVRWEWQHDISLNSIKCPICGGELKRTTHRSSYRLVVVTAEDCRQVAGAV